MPSREWKFRIQDIINAINKIDHYLNEKDLKSFNENSMMYDAVIRNLKIIGEASNHIPKEVQKQFPTIPWQQMKGLRNNAMCELTGNESFKL